MFPWLKEVGFYISETHWLLDWVINMVVMLGLKIAPKHSVRPLGKLLWWGMKNLPKPPYRVELQVHASGVKNVKRAQVRASITHADGYELTAIPVVVFLFAISGWFSAPSWLVDDGPSGRTSTTDERYGKNGCFGSDFRSLADFGSLTVV